MNATHYQKGGPVFFYGGGEAGLSDAQAERVLRGNESIFAPLELARKYHGIAIVWEHRFYGSSLPFPINATTGLAFAGYHAYKYLTNEQALEDAIYFATHFNPPGYDENEWIGMRPDSTPWIWLGGSYAGERAAMIRQRNPDVFYASWASSAPVEIVVDGSVYWTVLQQNMPANCSADVHAAITHADNILASGSEEEIALLRKAVFFVLGDHAIQNFNPYVPLDEAFDGPDSLTHWNMATLLAYPFHSGQPFQWFGYELSLGAFCNHLEKWNPDSFIGFNLSSPRSALTRNSDDAMPTAAGLANTYSTEEAWYAYLYALMRKIKDDSGDRLRGMFSASDRTSWVWQLCTEFGQFQMTQAISNPETNLLSRFYNISGQLERFCHNRFEYAPEVPDVKKVLRYGGWKMRPSNVMWTNGEIDPFRTMSVQATTDINPKALNRKTTSEIPKCNLPPDGDDVFGIVYEGGLHGKDLMKPTRGKNPGVGSGSPVDEGIELFSRALDVWLECFSDSKSLP